MATELPYSDPTADEAIANVMRDDELRDQYPQSYAETILAMLADPSSDNDDIAYMIRAVAPTLAA